MGVYSQGPLDALSGMTQMRKLGLDGNYFNGTLHALSHMPALAAYDAMTWRF